MAALPIRDRVTCPHCWTLFAPAEIRWVAEEPSLQGDPLLGKEHQLRFLPTRFTVDGQAIDVKGGVCHTLACPQCHLTIPRVLLEVEPLFFSIVGAPSSGKSYFLASMTRGARKTLPDKFNVNFLDSDPEVNLVLNSYEDRLFFNPNVDQPMRLDKTQQSGPTYDSVRRGERTLWYPHPFIFTIHPKDRPAGDGAGKSFTRALCLYDNAGEHFLPQGTTGMSTVTDHLSRSRVLLFLFDPLQHPEFRKACAPLTSDPQIHDKVVNYRQDQILLEAAKRIRNQSRLGTQEKIRSKLIVVVTKYDAWCGLGEFAGRRLTNRWAFEKLDGGRHALNISALQSMSGMVRELLMDLAAEVVTAAEGVADQVVYVPVSSLGRAPESDLSIRPCDIAPQGAEVPLVYALATSVNGLVAGVRRPESRNFFEAEDAQKVNTFSEARASTPRGTPMPETPAAKPKPLRIVTEQTAESAKPIHLKETGS